MRSIRCLALAALTAACGGASPAPQFLERARLAMGAELRLTVWTADPRGAERAADEVFEEVDRLDSLMSHWRHDSDIVRVNRAAGQQPVRVSPEVIDVLRVAREVGDWTGGKFDVTFGALADLWKFDHDQDNRIPPADAVRARLGLVDYQAVVVDESAGTVFLRREGMRLHLGGIGKGYAVDRAAALLRARGFRDFLIQAGGDLYAGGHAGPRPWRLGIRDPRASDRTFARLDVADGTFSTSGDYERFFIEDGRRYHHILDPDRGEPARACRSVTIVANRAVLADALSTGVFVLGPEAGMALIERLPDVEGVIVTGGGDVLVSSGLRETLIRLEPPATGS
jgi:thiamine biosynthesis lipoprotein